MSFTSKDDNCMLLFYRYKEESKEDLVTTAPKPNTMSAEPPASNRGTQETKDNKCAGPDSRTVTFAPENKKERVNFTEKNYVNMDEIFLPMYNKRNVLQQTDANHAKVEDEIVSKNKQETTHLFAMPSNRGEYYADILKGGIFRVDESTEHPGRRRVPDMATSRSCGREGETVRRGEGLQACPQRHTGREHHCDRRHLGTKMEEEPELPQQVREVCEVTPVCTRLPRPLQERHEQQEHHGKRVESTAFGVTAANKRSDPIESWDIAGAFLKGLTYGKLYKQLRHLGIRTVQRQVAVVVPRNVMRHLSSLSKEFVVPAGEEDNHILMCAMACLRRHWPGNRWSAVDVR